MSSVTSKVTYSEAWQLCLNHCEEEHGLSRDQVSLERYCSIEKSRVPVSFSTDGESETLIEGGWKLKLFGQNFAVVVSEEGEVWEVNRAFSGSVKRLRAIQPRRSLTLVPV